MELKKQSALENIDACKELLESMSDALWDHPETGYHEHFAARLYCRMLEKLGFQVEQGLAGIETAFSGTYGSGKPVIGFLGEFDALPGLSQQANVTRMCPVTEGGPGHGCGHNLLGVGALAAALGVKKYLEDNKLPGTVKFFGCPAEDGAGRCI